MKLDSNPRSIAGILLAVGVLGIGLVLTFGFFDDSTLLGVGVAMVVLGAAGLLLGIIHICAKDSADRKKVMEGDASVAPSRIPKQVPMMRRDDEVDIEDEEMEYRDIQNGVMFYEPCSVSPPRVGRGGFPGDDGIGGITSPNRDGTLVVPTAEGLMLSPYDQRSFPVPSMLGPGGRTTTGTTPRGGSRQNVVVVEQSQVGGGGGANAEYTTSVSGARKPFLPHQEHDMSGNFSPNASYHGHQNNNSSNQQYDGHYASGGVGGPVHAGGVGGGVNNNAFKKLESQLEQPHLTPGNPTHHTTTTNNNDYLTQAQTNSTTTTTTANAHGPTGTSLTGRSSYIQEHQGPNGHQQDPVLGSPSNAFRSNSSVSSAMGGGGNTNTNNNSQQPSSSSYQLGSALQQPTSGGVGLGLPATRQRPLPSSRGPSPSHQHSRTSSREYHQHHVPQFSHPSENFSQGRQSPGLGLPPPHPSSLGGGSKQVHFDAHQNYLEREEEEFRYSQQQHNGSNNGTHNHNSRSNDYYYGGGPNNNGGGGGGSMRHDSAPNNNQYNEQQQEDHYYHGHSLPVDDSYQQQNTSGASYTGVMMGDDDAFSPHHWSPAGNGSYQQQYDEPQPSGEGWRSDL